MYFVSEPSVKTDVWRLVDDLDKAVTSAVRAKLDIEISKELMPARNLSLHIVVIREQLYEDRHR